MNLLDSLLDAIVRLEGDALVMHVGEKPYVVTNSSSRNVFRGPLAWGQVELSSRVLTSDAVLGMLGQILPLERRQALEETGAIEHHIPAAEDAVEHFTVIAARGGDDVWLEVRRHPHVTEVEEQPVAETAPEAMPEAVAAEPRPCAPEEAPAAVAYAEEPVTVEPAVAEETIEVVAEKTIEQVSEETVEEVAEEPLVEFVDEPAVEEIAEEPVHEISLDAVAPEAEPEPIAAPPVEDEHPFEIVHEINQAVPTNDEVDELVAASAGALLKAQPPAAEEPQLTVAEEPKGVLAEEPQLTVPEEPEVVLAEEPQPEPQAVVLPLSRRRVKPTPQAAPGAPALAIDDLLRVAAARGASTVYVVAQSQPMVRTDGEISVLDLGNGAPLSDADIDRLVLELAPDAARESWHRGTPAEWMCDVADVGRVRCLTFRDHRGPGLIFRMIPPQAISADQLGLSADVQALCSQSDGLVLVTGPRASGKTTLMNAFVDLINRTRSDHVITVEGQIGFVHESRRSFVSQREVRDKDAVADAVRAALREDPDVLLIEDVRTAEIAAAALDAAQSGRLVFASLSAASTAAGVERLIELFPADHRAQVQKSLAGALRGVVAQVLVRRIRGGRLGAREVLFNTPAAAGLIQEGKFSQLPIAIESGRKQGMVPLTDALAALVRDGTVHVTEAYRKAFDKDALLAAFRREGVDTSFAERLA